MSTNITPKKKIENILIHDAALSAVNLKKISICKKIYFFGNKFLGTKNK